MGASAAGDVALAPAFLDDLELGNDHVRVDCLAHVVNGKSRDAHTRQRLHLDAGGPRYATFDGNLEAVIPVGREGDRNL